MTGLFYILAAIAAIVSHTTLTEYFSVWAGTRPDAILLFTLYLGIYRGSEVGLIGGFALGLFQDSLTGGLLGVNALSKGLIGHVTGNLGRNVASRNKFFQAGLGLFATVFDLVLAAALAVLFLPDMPIPSEHWLAGARTAILNMVLAPLVTGLLGRAEARVLPPAGGAPYPDRI